MFFIVTLNWCDALLITLSTAIVCSCSLDCLRLFYLIIVLFYCRRLLILVDDLIFSDSFVFKLRIDLGVLIFYVIVSPIFLLLTNLLETVIFCLIIVAKIFPFFLVKRLFVLCCSLVDLVKLYLFSIVELVFEAVERESVLVVVLI